MFQNRFSFPGRASWGHVALGIALALTSNLTLPALIASASGPVYQTETPRSLSIPAGGTATLKVRGFCLQFGKPFPTQPTAINGLANDKMRAALNYAIQKGYTEQNPEQAELAVWYLGDNTWHAGEHTIAQEVVNNATRNNAPTDSGDGIALLDAVAQNKASVKATFTPHTKNNFYGDADVEIKNTSASEIKIFMRVGVIFSSPGSNFQDLVAYKLGAEKVAIQQTPVASTTPAPTEQPTTQPTITAITTQLETTPANSTAGPNLPPIEAPTAALTAALTATSLTTSSPSPSQTPSPLPPTGAGSENTLLLTGLGAAIALILVSAGAMLASKRRP